MANLENSSKEVTFKFLDDLSAMPQPQQRSEAWYIFRHNLITASNAYKAFENQNVQNQLIYEKCQPLQIHTDKPTFVNVDTPFHWGPKYEPLSVMYYEKEYNTKVGDFGCIQHPQYSFLGASPDGINNDPSFPNRFGRMLEIKNIVNRDITGIPKKEYWIQMQLQMEVCDLDECDFLETKFTEYSDYESYEEDTHEQMINDENGIEFKNICLSKDNKKKGSIIYFQTKEGNPFYAYTPLDLIKPNEIVEWHDKTIDQYESENKYTYIKTIYWKLDIVSCVLVCRNKEWFNSNVSILENIWKTIEYERIHGYQHRAPNKRKEKEPKIEIQTETISSCLLKFNKENGKITVNKLEN